MRLPPRRDMEFSILRSQLHRAGPMGGLVIALLVNVAWIGLLVYGLTTLF